MSTEENKAVFRRWMRAWEQGDFETIDELVAPDYVGHLPGRPDIHGPDGDKQLVSVYQNAFPGFRFASHDLIAEGDRVVHRWTLQGEHQGDLMGISATGKAVAVPGISIFRFAGGQVAEGWIYGDTLSLLQQLGVMAGPAPADSSGAPAPEPDQDGAASAEKNKALVRRLYEEMWNQGNLAVADALLSPDYLNHGQPPDLPRGPEGNKQFLNLNRAAFPDMQYTIEDEVAEGDRVANRWTMRGTHQGALMGIPPTNRPVSIGGISIHRLAGGRVVESWFTSDRFGLLQQLGVIPTPGQSGD